MFRPEASAGIARNQTTATSAHFVDQTGKTKLVETFSIPAVETVSLLTKNMPQEGKTASNEATANSGGGGNPCGSLVLELTAFPGMGRPPLNVEFGILAYVTGCAGLSANWTFNFGDGQSQSGSGFVPQFLTHTYQSLGNYTATITLQTSTQTISDSVTINVVVLPPPAGVDEDHDGLEDLFENQLADGFTPVYLVSQQETNRFATFGNFVPQTALQFYGQIPVSHYAVSPWGFLVDQATNQLYSAIQIDYMTLWDYDGGIVAGGACSALPPLSQLEGISGHSLDNERSVILAIAPVSGFYINTSPEAYGISDLYTAAHEDIAIVNQSSYYRFSPGSLIPYNGHLILYLSRSKHATYTFNPNNLPIVSWVAMVAAYSLLDYYCIRTWIDDPFGWQDLLCLAAIAYVHDLFQGCITEKFTLPSAGYIANPRINVGEPSVPGTPLIPINGSAFINDTGSESKLYQKLTTPVFFY